jgi:orotate phosphoribosyltransferase/AMMECR1 domain-containing protein
MTTTPVAARFGHGVDLVVSSHAGAVQQLAALVRERGVLRSTPGEPILSRDGSRADWMLYTYPVTLSAEGSQVVAEAMLPVLRSFSSRQLVSVGYTAIPVMAGCVMHSDGEFIGGCVRDTAKAYGSGRRIEGALDRNRPVILIDDSISSGTSIRTGIQALEEQGFSVEGVVALVHFPWRGGVEWARGNGYRVETLLDVWRDVGLPLADHAHDYRCVQPLWSDDSLPDGLHPTHAARMVATRLLATGRCPRPPARFDREYAGQGGIYVSFRDPESEYRVARSGFWHFDARDADVTRDVVLATAKTVTAHTAALRSYGLDRLKIAVSFLGPLREIEPRDLDFDRLGLVVRSTAQPGKVGGALPHTEVFTSDVEQYRHAAFTNARLGRSEPHQLLVHTVDKVAEPGCYWLPYGSSDDGQEHLPIEVGEQLTARAEQALHAHLAGRALEGDELPDDLLPEPVFGVAVTLYAGGVIGCCISSTDSLDACVVRATRTAADDPRFADRRAVLSPDEISVSVSVLRDREQLGRSDNLARALIKSRPGYDTVGVTEGGRTGLLLPQVSVHHDWSKRQLASQLLAKARLSSGPASWTAYRTTSWLRRGGRTLSVEQGFPVRDQLVVDVPAMRETLALLCNYLSGQIQQSGMPAYFYQPVFDRTTVEGTAGRVLHALTALAEGGKILGRKDFVDASRAGMLRALDGFVDEPQGFAVRLPGLTSGLGADAELLLGLTALGDGSAQDHRAIRLRERLVAALRPDGRIDPNPRRTMRAEHDYLPGLALLAVASTPGALPDLDPQLTWYQRRFDLLHPWGIVGWHPQAWRAVWQRQPSDRVVGFVREIMQWALSRQHRRTGGFVTDLNLTGPSFHTAFVMEGVADAARLMLAAGEPELAAEYARSWRSGFALLDRLVIRDEDTYCMPCPERAVGGVRGTLTSSGVRIDYASHAAQSIVKALQYAESAQLWEVDLRD